jgi:AcrR family transcriptional regulator
MDTNKKNGKKIAQKNTRFIREEERRKQILTAARQVFEEKGYNNAKIEDIAVRAGIAHGTVYRYYKNKSDLATEIIGNQGASGFIESLEKNTMFDAEPAKLLKTVAEKYYGDLEERLPLMSFRIAQAVSQADMGRSYYRNLLHRLCKDLEKIVREYQTRGDFKAGDPFIFGHAFYGILFGFLYCQELLLGKELTNINLENIIDDVVDIFLYGVSDPSAKRMKKDNPSALKGKKK